MKPIRVLHVLSSIDYAGTETLLMNLYRNINRDTIQFDFAVCADHTGDYDHEIECLGGKIIHYPKYTVKNHLSYKKWWNSFFETHKEYKIVHGHIGSTAAIYLSVAKQHGLYTIAHSHATRNHELRLKDAIYNIYSYPTRYIADYFFGCSKEALRDRYGAEVADNPCVSKVFYNAIDVDKFVFNQGIRTEVRREFGISGNTIVLGTVGRLTAAKNPFMIVDILFELKRKGIDYIFLWFGRGELNEEIRNAIKKRNLDDRIIMGGVRNDIHRMLQGMDGFIFPSVFEGLGITCVEAQTADLTCFCSSNIPEEARITEKFNAISINDTDAWVNAIISFVNGFRGNRKNRSNDIKKAGYDIKSQTNWLMDFYLGVDDRCTYQ